LERHNIPKQPELHLSYAVLTYQTSGQFDAAMRKWHAKLLAKKTFPKFQVYIQLEFTKMVKRNKSTTGSIGKGIANKAMEEKISDAKAQAMVIAEVVNVLQAQNAEQMKTMMTMFEKLLANHVPAAPPIANTPKAPHQPQKKCPHCRQEARQS
jgi:hypothetical protein